LRHDEDEAANEGLEGAVHRVSHRVARVGNARGVAADEVENRRDLASSRQKTEKKRKGAKREKKRGA